MEVATDKLIADLPSPSKGVIHKLNYQLEENCPVKF